jgi:amidase
MVGTIGTAPAGAPISSLLYGPSHGGNMDCPAVREGATVLLPVNVPGALLSLGDVHALMGDGELTGTALEAAAEVTVTIGLEKQAAGALRLDAPGRIGSLGCVSDDVGANVAAATRDMIARLGEVAGHDAADAFQLIGLVGRLTVNQSVRLGALGWGSVLLTVPADCLAPK